MDKNILNCIKEFYNKNASKKFIYIDGDNGVGKTDLIKRTLNNLDYNLIWYSDITSNYIINILSNNTSEHVSILSYFKKKTIKNIIIIDDFNYRMIINKLLITHIIQYIKSPNKYIPIIIINNLTVNKKITYIKKYSYIFTISKPTIKFIKNIISNKLPQISEINMIKLLNFINNNLCKLNIILLFYKEILYNNYIEYNNLILINKLLLQNYLLEDYYKIISENDRTTLSLIYHENCIQLFPNNIILYSRILDNYTTADYLDRYIYQKQLWELSEWTNLIKLFYSNYLIKDKSRTIKVIFTKILTNYAIEYSNNNYIIQLCKKYNCKKNELIYYIKSSSDRLLKLYTNC